MKLAHTIFDPFCALQTGMHLKGWMNDTSERAKELLKLKLNLADISAQGRLVLMKSTDTFPEHFASGRYDECFDVILGSYVDILHHSGDVPTTRHAFHPPKDQSEILEHLAELGYLTSTDQGVIWTDCAAAAMLFACAWNPDLRSVDDTAKLDLDHQAQEVIRALDNTLLRLAQSDPDAAFWPIFYSLCGESWVDNPNRLLVERIIELAQSKRPTFGDTGK
jgi:hypothetical protein